MNDPQPWRFLEQYKGKFFDGLWPTVPEMFRITVERFQDRPCFTIYQPDRKTLSYKEAITKIEEVANFLADNGIKKGDKVAVTGKNSPEWAVTYLGVMFCGATVVPIDYQIKVEEITSIVKASDAVALFVDEEKYDNFDAKQLGLKAKWSLSTKKDGYVYDLKAKAKHTFEKIEDTDLAAILFTSGTTGFPKGVMLSHRNLVSDCYQAQGNMNLSENDVFYALLPIHHAYTMLAVFIEAISVGAEVVFGQRMVTTAILRELKEAHVTMFLGVPLLFNKVLGGILKGIKAKGPFVSGIISILLAISGFIKKVFKVNPGKKMFKSILEKASLSSIRICICGGGPLAPSIFKIYNQLGIDFVQGYGLTETSPIINLNPVDAYVETSVGKIIPGVEEKIVDPDEEGRGEVVIRGSMVMQGYYKNPVATQEVLKDGWLYTGDVGYLDKNNYLYLTGRAKNLIVTEGGKNVYPEEIEDRFQLYNEIDQILVKGYIQDNEQKSEGIEVLIFPSKDWVDHNAAVISADAGGLEGHLQKLVDEVNAKMLPYQRISKLTVLEKALEMTTTKKIKRNFK